MSSRVISHRLPSSTGRDSRFTIRHNEQHPGSPFWVHCLSSSGELFAADDPHKDLVDLVNGLKAERGIPPGGAFSINEHRQVIARMNAPPTAKEKTHHVIEIDSRGSVATYNPRIAFRGGKMDPEATPREGDVWPGPLCGMTYTFAAQQNPKPPSRNLDEIWMEVEGINVELSQDAAIDPYPPLPGADALGNFLAVLRRCLPSGGVFRVNERGRAFTPDHATFIGVVPTARWFLPLHARS